MRIPRRAAASLIAPLVFLLPVAALFVWQINQPVLIFQGEADDAPQRAVGAFVVALPIIYIVLSVVAYGIGSTLFRLRQTSLKRFTLTASSIGVAIGVVIGFAASSPGRYGWQDSLISVAAFTALLLASTAPAAVCWWYVAKSEA
jgi:hypothetical protein